MAYVTGATARINGTSISVSPTNPTAGNLLVALTAIFGNNPSNSTEAASDNANNPSANTWTRRLQQTANDADIAFYHAANCKNRSSGTFTVTATGSSGDRGMAYEEHSGIAAAPTIQSNSATGTGATHATGSITTSVTSTIIIAGSHATTDTATNVAATNYTFPAASVMEDSTNMPAAMGYRTGLAATTTSAAPTWENGLYAWAIVSFQEATAATKAPPPRRAAQRVIYRARRF